MVPFMTLSIAATTATVPEPAGAALHLGRDGKPGQAR